MQKSGISLRKCISPLSTSMIISGLKMKRRPGVRESDIAGFGSAKKSDVGDTRCRKDLRQNGQKSQESLVETAVCRAVNYIWTAVISKSALAAAVNTCVATATGNMTMMM